MQELCGGLGLRRIVTRDIQVKALHADFLLGKARGFAVSAPGLHTGAAQAPFSPWPQQLALR
jgi:hypothetical protein